MDLSAGPEQVPAKESLVKAEPGYSTRGLRPEMDQGWQN